MENDLQQQIKKSIKIGNQLEIFLKQNKNSEKIQDIFDAARNPNELTIDAINFFRDFVFFIFAEILKPPIKYTLSANQNGGVLIMRLLFQTEKKINEIIATIHDGNDELGNDTIAARKITLLVEGLKNHPAVKNLISINEKNAAKISAEKNIS